MIFNHKYKAAFSTVGLAVVVLLSLFKDPLGKMKEQLYSLQEKSEFSESKIVKNIGNATNSGQENLLANDAKSKLPHNLESLGETKHFINLQNEYLKNHPPNAGKIITLKQNTRIKALSKSPNLGVQLIKDPEINSNPRRMAVNDLKMKETLDYDASRQLKLSQTVKLSPQILMQSQLTAVYTQKNIYEVNRNCSCGLCPPDLWQGQQHEFIEKMIDQRISEDILLVPQNIPDLSWKYEENKEKNMTKEELAEVFSPLKSIVGPRQLFPDNLNMSAIIAAVDQLEIVEAKHSWGVASGDSAMKMLLNFQGGFKAAFKPKLNDIDEIVTFPNRGRDRANGEIASFYMAQILGLTRVPVAVGTKLNLRNAKEKANDSLQSLIRERKKLKDIECDSNLCWKMSSEEPNSMCYCPFCHGDYIEGVLSFFTPIELETSSPLPWQNYFPKPRTNRRFLLEYDYCLTVMSDWETSQPQIFLDIAENTVFDYLTLSVDRHHIELLKGVENSTVVLVDNARSFTQHKDVVTLLAPIYQCCKMRRGFYNSLILMNSTGTNLGVQLDLLMRQDRLYPILNHKHLQGINRRFSKLIILLEMCYDLWGEDMFSLDLKS